MSASVRDGIKCNSSTTGIWNLKITLADETYRLLLESRVIITKRFPYLFLISSY
jgi:hypothetical protein